MVTEGDAQALVSPRLLQDIQGCLLVSRKAPPGPQASSLFLRRLNIAL